MFTYLLAAGPVLGDLCSGLSTEDWFLRCCYFFLHCGSLTKQTADGWMGVRGWVGELEGEGVRRVIKRQVKRFYS